jgi:cell fate regulator YaaT (PSP1 superfamily)
LAYEKDLYVELKAKLPKRGQVIDTHHGRGKVIEVNVIKESVRVELDSQMTVEVSHQELVEQNQPSPPKEEQKKRGRRRKRRSRS